MSIVDEDCVCVVCARACARTKVWGGQRTASGSVLKYHPLFLLFKQALSLAGNSPIPQAAWLASPRDARISAANSVSPHLEFRCPQRPEELELQVAVSQLSRGAGT